MSKDANPAADPTSDDPSPVPAKPAPSSGQPNLEDLIRERDHYKTQADKLSALAKSRRTQIETLTAANRQHRHAKAWSDAAAKAGVKAELIDDAWTLSGYKPDADDPDPKKIGDVFKSLKETRPWLFGPGPDGGDRGGDPPSPAAGSSANSDPGPAPSTGKTQSNGSASRAATYADTQNAAYVYSRKPGQIGSIAKPTS